MHSVTQICVSLLWHSHQEHTCTQSLPNQRTRRILRAILKAAFSIFVAIMKVLVCFFAYTYQASKTLSLGCYGNTDKSEI